MIFEWNSHCKSFFFFASLSFLFNCRNLNPPTQFNWCMTLLCVFHSSAIDMKFLFPDMSILTTRKTQYDYVNSKLLIDKIALYAEITASLKLKRATEEIYKREKTFMCILHKWFGAFVRCNVKAFRENRWLLRLCSLTFVQHSAADSRICPFGELECVMSTGRFILFNRVAPSVPNEKWKNVWCVRLSHHRFP